MIYRLTLITLFASAAVALAAEPVISDAGVGPIRTKTPFSVAAIQKLFPTYQVKKSVSYTEDEPYPVILISAGGKPVLIINAEEEGSRSIFSVQVVGGLYAKSSPWPIGTQFSSIYRSGTDKSCAPGEEEMAGSVICTAPGTQHIRLVFEGNWDGSDGVVPPPSYLKRYTVSQIAWVPGAP
jgi:hypothetical protein